MTSSRDSEIFSLKLFQYASPSERISSSAAFERGLIVHLNGHGRLYDIIESTNQVPPNLETYYINPLFHSTTGSISMPSSSSASLMVNVERTLAATSHRIEVPICAPGHILRVPINL